MTQWWDHCGYQETACVSVLHFLHLRLWSKRETAKPFRDIQKALSCESHATTNSDSKLIGLTWHFLNWGKQMWCYERLTCAKHYSLGSPKSQRTFIAYFRSTKSQIGLNPAPWIQQAASVHDAFNASVHASTTVWRSPAQARIPTEGSGVISLPSSQTKSRTGIMFSGTLKKMHIFFVFNNDFTPASM